MTRRCVPIPYPHLNTLVLATTCLKLEFALLEKFKNHVKMIMTKNRHHDDGNDAPLCCEQYEIRCTPLYYTPPEIITG